VGFNGSRTGSDADGYSRSFKHHESRDPCRVSVYVALSRYSIIKPSSSKKTGYGQTRPHMTQFPQWTIGEIIDSEREMVLSAPPRYGKYYDTALQCSVLFSRFVKDVNRDRWIFISFLSEAKKHHTLALFSAVRLHKVQAMMNLRQALEAGAAAAFAIANPEHDHFVVADEYGILDPVPAGKRYAWLDRNYPDASADIKEAKDQINAVEAHANLITTQNTFRADYDDHSFAAPFFDIEDEHHVKTDLWRIAQVALVLMHAFANVNEGRNVIKFSDDFWPLIQTLGGQNNTLRGETMATDRFKHASELEAVRQAAKGKPAR